MRSPGDITPPPAAGATSRWAEPARAYAAAMLEPPAAAAAVREALDVLGPDDGSANQGGALTVVRDAVAKRVPRPVDVPPRSSGLFRRSTPPRACSQMPELLAARAASRLSPADVERLAIHLDSCPLCDALESRMAEAERAFRDEAEHDGAASEAPAQPIALVEAPPPPEIPGEPLAQEPAPAPTTSTARPPVAAPAGASAWLPEPLREAPADEDDIRVSRGGSADPAAVPASAWLIEPADAPATSTGPIAPPADPSDWLAPEGAPATATLPPTTRTTPYRPRGRGRALRVAIPVLLLALVAGGTLAATGAFDTGADKQDVAATPTRPADTKGSAAGSRTQPSAAERRRAAARRKATAERRRRAAARRKAAERRRAAAPAPVVRSPAPTPSPAPVVRTPATPPASTPPAATPTPTTPTPTPTPTPTRTTPSDAAKPSPPSSEPGRQVPPPS